MKEERRVDSEIRRRLEAARVPGPPSRMTPWRLRQLARGYLRDRDEELAEHPEKAGLPHWDLWMNDADLRDALFTVIVFRPRPAGMEFFCGSGDSFRIRRFCERSAPDDRKAPENLDELYQGFREEFNVHGGRLRVNRAAAEKWLGRGW